MLGPWESRVAVGSLVAGGPDRRLWGTMGTGTGFLVGRGSGPWERQELELQSWRKSGDWATLWNPKAHLAERFCALV